MNWKHINDYPDYAISDTGKVMRVTHSPYSRSKRILLKPMQAPNGYLHVKLFKSNTPKRITIHRLVAQAFIGSCPSGRETNHIDGNKTNNHIQNLEYLTKSENCRHAFSIGLKSLKGSKNNHAKLTEMGILQILSYIKQGCRKVDIAVFFDVTQRNIRKIASGTRWNHVTRILQPR